MNKVFVISMCLSATGAFTYPVTKTTSTFLVKSTTQEVPYFMDEAPASAANSPYTVSAPNAEPLSPPAPKAENDEVQVKRRRPYTVVKTYGGKKKAEGPTNAASSPNTVSAPNAETLSPQAPKTENNEVKVKRRRPYTVVKTYGGKKKTKSPKHKEGVFSPIVFASKKVVGEEEINKLRGKIISLHSNVIGDFVDTHQTKVGSQIARQLFVVMDANNDGTIDKDELKVAFETLGFTWLQDKQVQGILKRADKDNNGVIDYDEFEAELSKTLRVNLIKLAKKNGEEMGLLV